MTPFHLRSDRELLRATDDPAEAFAVFYRRHVEGVLRFAASRGASAETAADVVGDVFLAVLRGRHAYAPRTDDARTWLIGIAANKLADRHRSASRDARRERELRAYSERLTPRDLESYAHIVQAADGRVDDLLGDLPDAHRQAVRERVLEHRDYADIARDLGLTEQTARKHVSRGLARLRTQLGRDR